MLIFDNKNNHNNNNKIQKRNEKVHDLKDDCVLIYIHVENRTNKKY